MKTMWTVVTWGLILGLSACGPDGDADAEPWDVRPETEGEAQGAISDAAAAVSKAPDGKPGRVVIRMGDDMAFSPAHAVVDVGDTVVWLQDGDLPHTTSAGPTLAAVPEHAVLPEGAEPWDSGLLSTGGRFTVVFNVPGEYTYLCTLHEAAGMAGRITVR